MVSMLAAGRTAWEVYSLSRGSVRYGRVCKDFQRRSLLLSLNRCFLTLMIPVMGVIGPCAFGQNAEVDEDTSTPPGFQRVLERGRIASIDKPEFVTASEAEVAGDSWMMGLLIDGEARAYSLSLLNHHEVVNDVVGGKPVAAVW